MVMQELNLIPPPGHRRKPVPGPVAAALCLDRQDQTGGGLPRAQMAEVGLTDIDPWTSFG